MVGKGQNSIARSRLKDIVDDASKQEDPVKSASIYFYRIVKEHPFFGANRRTAFMAADVFLQLNGHRLKMSKDKVIGLTYKIRNENVKHPHTLVWGI